MQDAAEKPVDKLLAALRQAHPRLAVERLQVKHPADDDNLWFVSDGTQEVQFECHPSGRPPFLVEGGKTDERVLAQSVDDALSAIRRLLCP